MVFSKEWRSDVCLEGKTIIVTGGNDGMGKVMARDLYRQGGRVVIACRNLEKAEQAVAEIKNEPRPKQYNNDIIIQPLDLTDLDNVRNCAKNIIKTETRIDILINNAGVCGSSEKLTKDGFEIHFGVNHLGHFLLTLMLLPKIIKSGPARIVNVSSLAHNLPFIGNRLELDDINFDNRYFSSSRAYAQSKLANIVFTKILDKKLKESGINTVTTYSVHPGVIATDLGRDFFLQSFGLNWLWGFFSKYVYSTPEQGANNILYCALEEKIGNESGLYYSSYQVASPSGVANDKKLWDRLWEDSMKYSNLTDYNPFL